MDFHTAFENIITIEGGYSNTANDAGGRTKYGISERSYPDVDIDGLTKEQARDIYRRDYWRNCSSLPEEIRFLHFEGCVNIGVRSASKLLQKAINNTSDDEPISVDGIVGNITIAQANEKSRHLRDALIVERVKYYLNIVKRKRTQGKFLLGWLNRLFFS